MMARQAQASGYIAPGSALESYAREKAALDQRYADGLSTREDHQVETKKLRVRAETAAGMEALKLGQQLMAVLQSADRDAADRFEAGFWRPDQIDEKSVTIHQEQLVRQLQRATSREAAKAALDPYISSSDKGMVYAGWRAADVLRQRPEQDIARLAVYADLALQSRLERDEGYQAAIARQNRVVDGAKSIARELRSLATSAIGGFDPSANPGMPFSGRSRSNTAAVVAECFAVTSDDVKGWDPQQIGGVRSEVGPDGIATTYAASYKDVPPVASVTRHRPLSQRTRIGAGVLG
jgi:hypothetical protein